MLQTRVLPPRRAVVRPAILTAPVGSGEFPEMAPQIAMDHHWVEEEKHGKGVFRSDIDQLDGISVLGRCTALGFVHVEKEPGADKSSHGDREPAAKTGLDAPVLTVLVKFDDGKKEERVSFGKAGADTFASRPGEPGAAKIDTADFDDVVKALDEISK